MCKANWTFFRDKLSKAMFVSFVYIFCVLSSVFFYKKACLFNRSSQSEQSYCFLSQSAAERKPAVKWLLEFSLDFRQFKAFNGRPDWFTVIFTRVVIGPLWTLWPCLFSLQSCDFYFDNPKEANERGFNFEPLKVRVFELYFPLFCVSFSLRILTWERMPDGDWVVPSNLCRSNLCLFLISGGCWYWREKEHRVSMATSCRSWRKWQSYFSFR